MHVVKISAKVLQFCYNGKIMKMLKFCKYYGNYFRVKSFHSIFASELESKTLVSKNVNYEMQDN